MPHLVKNPCPTQSVTANLVNQIEPKPECHARIGRVIEDATKVYLVPVKITLAGPGGEVHLSFFQKFCIYPAIRQSILAWRTLGFS